jgi:hypothetical protein
VPNELERLRLRSAHHINILENGFRPEFKQAQAKLQANIAAGLLDFGNVRLIGMTPDELRNAYMLPQDIIDNTIKAYSVNATGYGSGAPTGRYFAPGRSCGSTST